MVFDDKGSVSSTSAPGVAIGVKRDAPERGDRSGRCVRHPRHDDPTRGVDGDGHGHQPGDVSNRAVEAQLADEAETGDKGGH